VSPRLVLPVRIFLVLMALSLVFVAVHKGREAQRYFSPLVEVPGTVLRAELTDPKPFATADPRAKGAIVQVPSRLRIDVREFPELHFVAILREEPGHAPALPAPGESVTLLVPALWRDLMAGDRVLTIGVKRGTQMLVDPAEYPYAAEYRMAYTAFGAALGAILALVGAWRLRAE
jgi:hypothetical protein